MVYTVCLARFKLCDVVCVASRIISEITQYMCYHSNYGISSCCALVTSYLHPFELLVDLVTDL